MIYGNMDGEETQKGCKRKRPSKISDFFQKSMSATSRQHNTKLTKDALKKISNDDWFATFYQTVLR